MGLEETLPVLELLVDERLDSNSEMIEDARVLEAVSVPVVVVSDSVVAVELSSEDLQPKKRILTKKKMKIILVCRFMATFFTLSKKIIFPFCPF